MTKNEFWVECFLTSAPSFLDGNNWTQDGQPLVDLQQKVQLCSQFADRALAEAQKRNLLQQPQKQTTAKAKATATQKPKGSPP